MSVTEDADPFVRNGVLPAQVVREAEGRAGNVSGQREPACRIEPEVDDGSLVVGPENSSNRVKGSRRRMIALERAVSDIVPKTVQRQIAVLDGLRDKRKAHQVFK